MHFFHFSDADKAEVRDDIRRFLDKMPAQASAVLIALEKGEIDGRSYVGPCSCFIGTLAKSRFSTQFDSVAKMWHRLEVDAGIVDIPGVYPVEEWFGHIEEGDTPQTNPFSKFAHECIMQWMEERGMLK